MVSKLVVQAPVRAADLGGWTDTWFARRGLVCNVAVAPGVEVSVDAGLRGRRRLVLSALGLEFDLPASLALEGHPMIEAILAAHPPPDATDITITSDVPPGSGMGTSAAVAVALLAALRTMEGATVDPHDLAVEAHALETSTGRQSGVQDHAAAAFGGACEVRVRYPDFDVTPIDMAAQTWTALEERFVSVYLGRPHHSSDIHHQVIARLSDADPEPLLAPLRQLAAQGVDALRAGDLRAYARALDASVDAQQHLEPALICADARQLVGWCRELGAAAKINGAGGDGGSVSVLLPHDSPSRVELVKRIDEVGSWWRLGLRPTQHGVTVFQS